MRNTPSSSSSEHRTNNASYEGCRTCEQERARSARIAEDLRLKEEQERGLLRQIAHLKGEITKRDRARVSDAEVQAVFDHWAEHVAGRADVVLGESRKKMIRDRIREQRENGIEDPVARCKQALDGLKKRPYVKAGGGRVARSGPGTKRYAMLEHALRDEKAMEACIGYLEEPDNVVELRPRQQHRDLRDPFARPLDRALVALRREFGCDAVRAEFGGRDQFHADAWWSVCPLHPTEGHPMRIRERGTPGSSVELACAKGCLPSLLDEAVRGLEDKRGGALVAVEHGPRIVPPEAI